MNTRGEAELVLRRIAGQPDEAIDVAEGALALAALDRPRVDLARYRRHLAELAADLARALDAGGGETRGIAACVAALNATLFERHGYAGDSLTYDDPQNANLMRVIDRRKGLPVVLGILCLHAGRVQGWHMAGLAFPGHFLVRLDHAGERAILDPFNGGARCGPAELRGLLKDMAGAEAELRPEYHAPVGNRDVLLRLQNNVKLRLLQSRQTTEAVAALESMLALAPDRAELWWEAGVLHARIGNLRAAVTALQQCIELCESESARYRAATLLQELRAKIN